MKILTTATILLLLFLLTPPDAFAKALPQARGGAKQTAVRPAGNNVAVSPRLRRDKHALNIYFSNLQKATGASYTLTYQTQGRQEGAGGSIRQEEGNSTTRELLFGTCSKNVCTYHQGIKNMKLEVTGQLKSGRNFTKRFRIRV